MRAACVGLATRDTILAVPRRSPRTANTAASLSCRALDGPSAIPTLDELERSLS